MWVKLRIQSFSANSGVFLFEKKKQTCYYMFFRYERVALLSIRFSLKNVYQVSHHCVTTLTLQGNYLELGRWRQLFLVLKVLIHHCAQVRYSQHSCPLLIMDLSNLLQNMTSEHILKIVSISSTSDWVWIYFNKINSYKINSTPEINSLSN